MSTGTSKTRTQRLASITAVPTRLHLAVAHLRQRSSIFCCLIFLTAFVVLLLALRVWNPHFKYYEGMVINRDIVARVAFETIDTVETEKEKVLAANRIPYVYVRDNNPQVLEENINTIYRIIKEASKAESFDKLPPELQQQFKVPDDSQVYGTKSGTHGIWQFLQKNPEPSASNSESAENKGNEDKIVVKVETNEAVREAVREAAKEEENVAPDGEMLPNAEEYREKPVPESEGLATTQTMATTATMATPEERIGMDISVPQSARLESFCDLLEEAMKPFCAQGLMHIAEVKEDPLGRGLQVQIAVVDAENPSMDGVKTSLKTVILEDNEQIREAIRKTTGDDKTGDQIYYCICRNWKSNLVLDSTLTNEAICTARQSVQPIKKQYQVSQRLVQAQVHEDKLIGTYLTEEMVKLLSIENEKWLSMRSFNEQLQHGVVVSVLLLLILSPIWIYIVMVEPRIIREVPRLIFVLLLCLLVLFIALWSVKLQSMPRGCIMFPMVLFSQIITIQYCRRLGILFCGMLLLCLSVALQMSQLEVLCDYGILLTAILPLDRLRGRMQFVRVSIWATITAFLFYCSADLVMGVPFDLNVLSSAMVNSLPLLLAGLMIQSLLPLLERHLGLLSDVRLLELCDVSNPLLNELINRAPSTYSHSIALGTIGENAADAIGANGLLVRTAAYYHDVGKIFKPNYYAENLIVKEESPHNTLEPNMSALIIIAHVKNGVDLARQYKLPIQIVDLIEQHHGNALVSYFYYQACKRREQNPNIPDVEECSFRYPCPRPQTKEAVVLMLSDACESACRALVEPTPARIQSLVRKLSQERLEDEQFDESGITLKELRTVEDVIIKGLISYHHGRIKYPERVKH